MTGRRVVRIVLVLAAAAAAIVGGLVALVLVAVTAMNPPKHRGSADG